jgi:hypothetical protein
VEKIHPELFKGANRRCALCFAVSTQTTLFLNSNFKAQSFISCCAPVRFKNVPWSKLERRRHDKELTPAELARRVSRAIKKDKERQKKILEAGIEYEYPPLGSLKPVKAKKKVFSVDE